MTEHPLQGLADEYSSGPTPSEILDSDESIANQVKEVGSFAMSRLQYAAITTDRHSGFSLPFLGMVGVFSTFIMSFVAGFFVAPLSPILLILAMAGYCVIPLTVFADVSMLNDACDVFGRDPMFGTFYPVIWAALSLALFPLIFYERVRVGRLASLYE